VIYIVLFFLFGFSLPCIGWYLDRRDKLDIENERHDVSEDIIATIVAKRHYKFN
jgi:hypothetical protein